MEIEYSTLMNSVSEAIKAEALDEHVGIALLRGNLQINDIGAKEIVDAKLQPMINQTSYAVIKNLKVLLGDDLKIMENGQEVEFE